MDSAETRAKGGSGRAPGRGKGQLDEFVRARRSVEQFKTGPDRFRPFDERSRKRDAGKSRERSDFFTDNAGRVQQRVWSGRSNFRATNGEWTPIDTALEPRGGRLRQKANDLEIQIAQRANDPRLVGVALGGNQSVEQRLDGAAKVEGKIDGANATFIDALPHTDLRLETNADGVKEILILKSAEAANEWTFPLTLKGLTARINEFGEVEYVDGDGKVALISPRPFMTDSAFDPATGEPVTSNAVRYELVETEGKPALRVVADQSWIRDEARKWPIRVDPPVSYPDTMDTYTDSTTPGENNASEGTMAMGTPNNGARKARAYMDFKDVPVAAADQRIQSVTLNIFLSYVADCSAQTFDVHTIKADWTAGGLTTYSTTTPPLGSKLGSATPTVSTADACGNSPVDPFRGKWVQVPLTPSAFRNWPADGIYGLALKGADTGNTWKRFTSANVTSLRPYLQIDYRPNVAGQVDEQSVADASSLEPQFIAKGTDPDAFPRGGDLDYEFKIYEAPYVAGAAPVAGSGVVSTGNWRVPAGKLAWATDYVWTVQTYDGLVEGPADGAVVFEPFTTTVPQPRIGATLSKSAQERGVDPNSGNLTNVATDASVVSVGPELTITRTYGSRDPRTSTSFGSGWSTQLDQTVSEVRDPRDNALVGAVVTHADGHRERYARDAAGKFLPGEGFFADLAPVPGGYRLIADSTTWTFTHAVAGQSGVYAVTGVTDGAGRALSYTRTNGLITKASTASGRSLTFTWTTPAAGIAAHVSTVTTDRAVPSDPASAQTWTYTYSGDRLTKVCSPISSTQCTVYAYQTGSHYPTVVHDSAPHAWWRFGETGGTTAYDAILDNQNRYPATYSNVTLNSTASGISNGGGKAADFNGTSSRVTLPRRPDWNVGTISFGLWFKTTTPDRVLMGWAEDDVSKLASTTRSYHPVFYLGTDGKLRAQLSRGGTAPTPLTTAVSVADGNWHHVVLTASGGSTSIQALYLDGNLVGSQNRSAFNSKRTFVTVGAGFIGDLWPGSSRTSSTDPTGYASWFKGSVADLTVHDRTLGAGEVKAMWNAATSANAAQLTQATTRAGRVEAQATWDVYHGAVATVMDSNGGFWGVGAPQLLGSSTGLLGAIRTAGPLAYWRLGDNAATLAAEDSGELTDYAAYNTVTLNGTGPFGAGDSTAAVFNGTTSYLTPPVLPQYDIGAKNAATVSLWFKTTTAGRVLFGWAAEPVTAGTTTKSTHPALYIGTDGKLYGQFWNGAVGPIAGTSPVTDGKWHQVTLTGGAGKQTLYLDGVSLGEKLGAIGLAGLPNVSVGAGFAGAWPNLPNPNPRAASYFQGSLAEVAVYDRPLSAAEIKSQWSAWTTSSTTYPIKTIVITGPVATLADLSDPSAPRTVDRFDPAHTDRVLAHTDTNAEATSYTYDENGYQLAETDPNGNSVVTGRDERGNMVSRVVCQNSAEDRCSTETWEYFPTSTNAADPRNDKPISYEDPRGEDYTTTYDYTVPAGQVETGQPTTVIGPENAGPAEAEQTATTYTTATTLAEGGGTPPIGLVETVTVRLDATRNAVTRYTYYANGDLASTTDPLGLVRTFLYDGLGRLTATTVVSDTYPGGVVTTQTYDALNRVATSTAQPVTDAVTGVVHTARTTTTYDPDNFITASTISDLTGGDLPRTTTTAPDSRGRTASITDPTGAVESYEYDIYGNTIKTTAPDGTVTVSTYDSERRLLTTTLKDYAGDGSRGPGDLLLEYRAYDDGGRLARVTDAMGWSTLYTYTGTNLVDTVVRVQSLEANAPRFVVEDNEYDPSGSLQHRLTNNGATQTDFLFDASGRLTTTTVDPTGLNRATTLLLDPQNRVLKTTRTGGGRTEVETNEYDIVGNLTSRTVGEGTEARTSRWEYDRRGLVVAEIDPLGNRTVHFNDELGRRHKTVAPAVLTEAGPEGSPAISLTPITLTGYNSFDEPVSAQDPNGNRTLTAYDGAGRVVSVTSPPYTPPGAAEPLPPSVARTAYDSMGRVVSETDALDRVTTHSWDQLGRRLSSTAPGNATTTYTYDSVGDLLSTTTPLGNRTETTWDYKARKLTDTRIDRTLGTGPAAALTTTYTYGTGGWLSQERSPAGVTTSYTYNPAGERISSTDAVGNTTTYDYDLMGRQIKVVRPDSTASTTTYDSVGNAVATADLDTDGSVLRQTATDYDLTDRTIARTDPNGTRTTWTRDAHGTVTGQTEPIDDTTSIVVGYGHDPAGNLTRVTDGRGNVFRTTYNSWNLPESTIEPATPAHQNAAGRTWTTTYDALARPVRTQAPGGVSTTSTYDQRGNLLTQTGTGAEAPTGARSFEYDLDDRMTKATTPAAENVFAYNDRGLLVSTTGQSGNATFAYDPDGRMTVREDAAGRTTATWDSAGRLATVLDAATGTTHTRSYDVNSQPVTASYGAGTATRVWAYDRLHRLTGDTLAAPGGAVQSRRTYGYDANDNVVSESVTGAADAGSDTYAYDRANRLTAWTHDGATTTYAYDPAGNRITTAAENGATTTYTWTPRGTLATTTGAKPRASTADAFDQLATDTAPATAPNGGATGPQAYTYDALARRITAAPAGGGTGPTHTLRYSGVGHDLAADGTARYALDPDGALLAVAEGTNASLAWTDRHSDVVAAYTPSDGTLTGSTAYNPWGEVTARLGTVPGRAGYQSDWTDPGTNGVDMWHRSYDPTTGTFDTRDPQPATAGTGAGTDADATTSANRYAYGNANPLNRIDPDGMFGRTPLCAMNADNVEKICRWTRKQLDEALAADRFASGQAHSALAARQARQLDLSLADLKQGRTERIHALIAMNVANSDSHNALVLARQAGNATFRAFASNYIEAVVDAARMCEGQPRSSACKFAHIWAAVWKPQQCGANWFWCVVDVVSWLTIIMPAGLLGGRVAKIATTLVGKRAEGIQAINRGVWQKARNAGERQWKKIRATSRTPEEATQIASRCVALGNSFAAETPVLLASGDTRPISQIEVGDRVRTADPIATGDRAGTVTAVHVHDDDDLLDVALVDRHGVAERIRTTRDHKFWDDTARRWLAASELVIGTKLRARGGTLATVTELAAVPGTATMWDLTVETTHTYYVIPQRADGAVGGAVLVHNASCGPDFGANVGHIFRKAKGHFARDTAENRARIRSIIAPDNRRSTTHLRDGGRIDRYSLNLPDGTQLWAEVRNGTEITNGGLNARPR